MKIFLSLSFTITLFVFSCSTDTHRKIEDTSVRLRTSNKQVQANFDSCLRLTQQLIKTQVSDKEFEQYFSLNEKATGFVYENVLLHITDSLFDLPKGYQIFYDFIYRGDTITSFRADFDASLRIIDYRNFHLIAFRKFIDKELPITENKAREIAIRNGMKKQDLDLIFYCLSDKFYWECKNNCDGCLYLEIDAKSGNVIGKGKIVYQYKQQPTLHQQ